MEVKEANLRSQFLKMGGCRNGIQSSNLNPTSLQVIKLHSRNDVRDKFALLRLQSKNVHSIKMTDERSRPERSHCSNRTHSTSSGLNEKEARSSGVMIFSILLYPFFKLHNRDGHKTTYLLPISK